MRAGHAVIAILATLLGSLPAAWASHTCDALGRRVAASIDGATTRYYRDGRREIEERDGTDARKRYHINGGLYVDERVASYEDAGGQFRYYLAGDQFTVVGSGDANGANIVRYPAGALGDFVCETPVACNGCATPSTCPGDANGDGCVDNSDLGILLAGYGTTLGQPFYSGCADFDCDNDIDNADLGVLLASYGNCCADCEPPPTGTFTLHGRPLDTLADGKVLIYIRARFYDPQHGRWLQRDPSGYVDGGNLYESFRGNATSNVDPSGRIIEELFNWWYSGKYASYEELQTALRTGRSFSNVRSGELIMLQNAGEATLGLTFGGGGLVDPMDVVRETGAEISQRHAAAVDATTQRLFEVAVSQMEAGASVDDATSATNLSAVFLGDVTGVTPLLESGYDVDLATNTTLSNESVDFLAFQGDERFRRGLQGGGQVLLIVVGSARTGGAQTVEAAPVAPAAASALRARVLSNITESAAARTASRFEVYAGREATFNATSRHFAGVRALSWELRVAGVPRAARVQTVESSAEGTVSARVARGDEVFLRFFGAQTQPTGRFLTPFIPSTGVRSGLALPPENAASGIRQFTLRPGSTFFEGRVAPNFGQPGGGVQVFIMDTGQLVVLP